ncbi:MAG: DinB family protein [Reyranella sp.]|nr:DinB family protein [Reyranella sp.]
MTAPWVHLARYNRLANEALYEACAALRDEERRRDLGAFFGSVHGTLNHLLLGDRIWMTRFEGGNHPSTDLGAILHDDFAALRVARAAMDARIELFFARLPPGFADGTIRYVNNAGYASEDSLAVLLPHFFNHQTHHRAQVHTLLSQLGRDPPSLDLHRVLRPNPV